MAALMADPGSQALADDMDVRLGRAAARIDDGDVNAGMAMLADIEAESRTCGYA